MSRLPGIADSALSILEGVRRRGAERGDIMDRATESVLIPQICGESFALAIIDIIKALNTRASVAYSQSFLTIADNNEESANRDQLDESMIDGFVGSSGIGIQDCFIGSEWLGLLFPDLQRYMAHEKMTDQIFELPILPSYESVEDEKLVPESSKIAWIEPGGTVEQDYPALFEVIQALHALPYEINGNL